MLTVEEQMEITLRQRSRVVRARRHALRMRQLRPPDEPDIGHAVHGTRKPLRLWFRALWEICVYRHGISAADLQRVLGLGSYETAWAWAHRIRRALVRENRAGLQGCVQVDEAHVGGKNADKAMVIVAAEEGRRLRLIHAPGNHEDCIKHVVDEQIEIDAAVKTDGHAAYNGRTLATRNHDAKVQSPAEKKSDDHVQLCHWAATGLKRWRLGTHHGAVSDKHLQSYLDEHAFRQNRRKTKGVGRLVARCLENMLIRQPLTMRQLIQDTHQCRVFEGIGLLNRIKPERHAPTRYTHLAQNLVRAWRRRCRKAWRRSCL